MFNLGHPFISPLIIWSLCLHNLAKNLLSYSISSLSAWIWISAATCSWYETWWGSDAQFLHANGSAGAARAASWWQACRNCAAKPAASSTNAAAGWWRSVSISFHTEYYL